MSLPLTVTVVLLVGYALCVAAVHHDGDFIHTSRRSQFQGVRLKQDSTVPEL